jgi:hypothetical protein
MPSQEAFMTVLNELGRQSWAEYTGYSPDVIEPVPGDMQFHAIQQRVGHWLGEGYRRLIPLTSGGLLADSASPPSLLPTEEALAPAVRPQLGIDIFIHVFRVAFSFPGEARQRIGPIARNVQEALGPASVFYDEWYKAELARPNLDLLLQGIYTHAELVVACLCAGYERKEWCGLEWRAIRELIKKRQDRIMLLRLDDVDVAGSFSIDGYIDLRTHDDTETGALVVQRVTGARLQMPQRHTAVQSGVPSQADVSAVGSRLSIRVQFRDQVLCNIELMASVQVLPRAAPEILVRFGDYATGVSNASNIIESCALAELERHSSTEARQARARIAEGIEAAARPRLADIGFTLHSVALRTITAC